MGLFKINGNRKTTTIGEQELSEKELEDLIEKNPGIIPDIELLLIGRQVPTDYNAVIDLLGITAAGNTVIIELKKGKTPREAITQVLEYAVYVEKLGYEELNRISSKYSEGKSLRKVYVDYFAEGSLESIIENVNREQLLVIIAKEIDDKTEELARYLRERGVNLRVLKYTHFSGESGEKYLHIETVVGKETMKTATTEASPFPDFYKLLDDVIDQIPNVEFSAPEIFEQFKRQFPNEMVKLQEKYKGHFTPKNYIALSLLSYSKRQSATFTLTDKTIKAPSEWGYPTVKVFRKKSST